MVSPVLLLIDFQKGHDEIAARTRRNNIAAEQQAMRLLTFWREHALPVIHVRHNSTRRESVFRPDHPGNRVMDFAAEIAGEPVLRKTVSSAFGDTDLARRLEALGRPEVVVAGASTDHCVSTTIRAGANLGFRMVLAADACFTFERVAPGGRVITAEEVHEVNVASLAGEFARIVASQALLADLSRAMAGLA